MADQTPYDVWVQQGHLVATPGPVVRMDIVAARVAEAEQEYALVLLAFDAYAFRRNLEPELDELGVEVELVEHPQGGKRKAAESGLWMPGSLNAFETMILERRVRIRRNPVVIAAFMSAAIEKDAFDNRWFSKRRATNRIDPLIAATMAAGTASANAGGSVYEERGLLVL